MVPLWQSGVWAALLLCAPGHGDATSASVEVETATTLLDAWQLEDALLLGRELLAAAPERPEHRLLAAELLHQRGQHLQALALLRSVDDVSSLPPRRQALLPRVAGSASYAGAFERLETPHFTVAYLDKDEVVATYAGPILEAAYRRIGDDLGFLPAERGEKIAVEIYPDARGLAAATGLTLKEIETSGTIAVCKYHRLMITSPLATTDGYGWGDTLAHEFTHLIISKRSRNTVPIWLHEGIAKYFESRWKGAAGMALTPYAESLLAQAVRRGHFITFAQMHPSMAKLPSQDDAALAFAEVFTVIEFLQQRFGTASIAKLLSALGDGLELGVALQKVFGLDLAGVEKAWKKSLAKRTFRVDPEAAPRPIRLASPADDGPKERPLEKMADRRVHDAARLGELLQLRGQTPAAIVEYEKALAQGGHRYPTLVTRLARAYAETHREAEARALLDRVLESRPDETDAHLLAGRLALQAQAWAAATQHFEQVRLQNPFNPEVHVALAKLYEAAQPQLAAQEKRFITLCSQPRPARRYTVPDAPTAAAYLSVVTWDWREVTLDGKETFATPAWDHPVQPGQHNLRSGHDGSVQAVEVGSGARAICVLPSVAPVVAPR